MPASAAETLTGKVVAVADGDTLTLLTGQRRTVVLRLAQIDAPEKSQPWGSKSKRMLSDLVERCSARVTITDHDRYGRGVGQVSCGLTDVNAEMVKRGGAWAYRTYLTDQKFIRLETIAKSQRRGLWALPPQQTVAPWIWRARRRDAAVISPAPGPKSSLTCGAKRYCRQMSDCDEAIAYLRHCGAVSLDGDGDGTPCETLCRRRVRPS